MKKKLFLLSAISLITSCYPKTEKVATFKDNKFVRIINFGLEESENGGQFVYDLQESGKCAQKTLKQLHTLNNIKDEKELQAFLEKLKKNIKSKNFDDNSGAKTIKTSRQQIVEILRDQLIYPREEFLILLHGFSSVIKIPLKISLSGSRLGDQNSILLNFMEVKSSEVQDYFYKNINTESQLKQACSEFIIFCKDLWGTLSPSLMQKRRIYIEQQASKKAEESSLA